MNRYVAAGLATDMAKGRRVLVVAASGVSASVAFHEVRAYFAENEQTWAHGRQAFGGQGAERIETVDGGPGTIVFIGRNHADEHRGHKPYDVVYLEPGLRMEPHLILLLADGGEVIDG